jgi:hypothetical protein
MAWERHGKTGEYLDLWSGSCCDHGTGGSAHRHSHQRSSIRDEQSGPQIVDRDRLGSWPWISGLNGRSHRHKLAAVWMGDVLNPDYWLVSRSRTSSCFVIFSVLGRASRLEDAFGIIFSRASICRPQRMRLKGQNMQPLRQSRSIFRAS